MKVLVLGGKGAVGKALVDAYEPLVDTHVLDVDARPDVVGYDFMHVAIPWQVGDFVNKVREAQKDFKARRLIIHSTVPVGTTRQFGESACHSPILGQHDDLGSSLTKFTKWYGPVKVDDSLKFKEHLELPGITAQSLGRPEDTEFAKLACLRRFLHDLAYYQEMDQIARKLLVPKSVLANWTRAYNAGYAGTQFVRPNLRFPEGKVGGKCVLQGATMLFQQAQGDLLMAELNMFAPVQAKPELKVVSNG